MSGTATCGSCPDRAGCVRACEALGLPRMRSGKRWGVAQLTGHEGEVLRIVGKTGPSRGECAVRDLPDRTRAMMQLKYIAGNTYREIGRAFGIREGAARSAVYRGRKRLTDTLDERGRK